MSDETGEVRIFDAEDMARDLVNRAYACGLRDGAGERA